jgi:predicted O-methyltransferase YrrM
MSTPRRRFRDRVRGLVFPGWQRLVDERPEFQAQVNRVATDLHRYRWFHDHVDDYGLVPYLNEDLADTARFLTWQPPGHFYSAVPSWSAVEERSAAAFDRSWRALPGVPIDEDEHVALLAAFVPLWADLDGIAAEPEAWRYGLGNSAFNPADARVLYALLRHLRPARVVEVGSGHSSALLLDAVDRHLQPAPEITLVEPYPQLVRSLLRPGDEERLTILESPVQEVDPSVFTALQANDVLFIDDSHVSKVDSDVNHLFFEVLPLLAPGVWVHVHDVFFPFEYPKAWIEEGRTWNESYLLRAFLQFNSAFRVGFFSDVFLRSPRLSALPGAEVFSNGCGSIWLRRVA